MQRQLFNIYIWGNFSYLLPAHTAFTFIIKECNIISSTAPLHSQLTHDHWHIQSHSQLCRIITPEYHIFQAHFLSVFLGGGIFAFFWEMTV